jgi:exopolyphosphatase/guanosine-5'-triphosphate,3'-diphosphate pyrophosphatase
MKVDVKPRFIYPNEPSHKKGRFAVIDIGSSTMRLVVYDEGLYPHLFLNHKVRIRFAIEKGEGVFVLDDERMDRALNAIEWFLWVCKESAVETVVATATSAVREAENGSDFVNMIHKKTGLHVEVISGEVEARLSAEGGVISLPDASGLVMDLGGGSLDICETNTRGEFASLPLGVLSLQKLSGSDPFKAVEIVKDALRDVNWVKDTNMRDLVALGAGMRSIASLHMNETNYPMHILHGYSIPKEEALRYCRKFLDGHIDDKVLHLARGYEDVMPYRAAALTALLESGDFEQVRFASFGIREGILFSQIEQGGVGEDPLISYGRDVAERDGRGVQYAMQLAGWVKDILPQTSKRLLDASALLCDTAWREQYTYRASTAFEIVYGSPFVACSHEDRAQISLMVYFAHADELKPRMLRRVKGLVSQADMDEAQTIGALIHLASFLDPGARGMLRNYSLKKNDLGLFEIEGPEAFMKMESESVQKRLDFFNKSLAK